MQLIAIHSIQRRGENDTLVAIAPKTVFDASGDEAAFLIAAGAARQVTGKAAATPTAPATEPDDTTRATPTAPDELAGMTKADLIRFAADNGVEIDEKASKADILETLRADLAAGDELV